MTLKMNDSNTEYMVIGTQKQLFKCVITPITIGDSTFEPSESVHNLVTYLDIHMSMELHTKKKCQATYLQLHNIGKVRKFLDRVSAEILIHFLVFCYLDFFFFLNG